jgi:pseudouridine synthase
MSEILQKFIAASGLCSRRAAEELIRQGRVRVNGYLAELGMRVSVEDEVLVSGKKLFVKEKIYLKLNKPIGYTCTNRSFKGEKNVFDLLPATDERLFVSGRLDKSSHGLVLLTNDGDLDEKLTHPRYEHEKEYLVRLENLPENFILSDFLVACRRGFPLPEIGRVKMKDIKYLGKNEFKVLLAEGKKRQIRRMFEKFSLRVIDLKRVRMASLLLGNLSTGKWAYLTKREIKDLM